MSLYPLMVSTLPKAVAAHGVRPAAVALFDTSCKLLGSRFMATRAARKPYHDDELLNKTYTDRFDESDSLEAGKTKEVAKPVAPPVYPTSLWASHFRDMDNFFLRDEINETDESVKVSVDVPESIRASDMHVKVDKDGTVLHVSGKREVAETDGSKTLHQFNKRFSIGPHLDVDNLTANFSDGVLVLSAPKVEPHAEEPQEKIIPITEEPHLPTEEEIIQKNHSSEFDESDWVETGKAA